jgi:hypothetical protein
VSVLAPSPRTATTTVAVMQPYFHPYAGYFRLFEATDLFVILDCVQFPRRGWVHRNRFLDDRGRTRWLTLPLARAPFTTRIRELRFAATAAERFRAETRRFRAVRDLDARNWPMDPRLAELQGEVVDYLARQLRAVTLRLDLPFEIVRSSELDIDSDLQGQERMLAILHELRARTYVNAPGGVELYDREVFARRDIRLRFLSPWKGNSLSILQRLHTESVDEIRADIRGQTRFLDD